ncbi:hypothetical protein DEO72_LG4g1323 [Vigna unguiculata]|uniref:Uncharacterized protein n=1 Tax=Vigna unguiculata TaxID=3917 RepID=A0A4D6LPR0_VIGUN|nr:hypothetical protein DEO72_LG4g1323 [Vigna unguiculata]
MSVGPKGCPKGNQTPKFALTYHSFLISEKQPLCPSFPNTEPLLGFRSLASSGEVQPDLHFTSLIYSRSCCVPLFVPKDPAASLFSREEQWRGQGCTRALAQAKAFVLSEAPFRSGERRSPKRAHVRALACCSCFSPGEEPHLWARGCLAQARRARLSEPCESLPASLSRSHLSESPPLKRGHSSHLSEGS